MAGAAPTAKLPRDQQDLRSILAADAFVPAPGVYRLQLLAGESLLSERLLEARMAGGQVRAPARDDG